MECLSGIDSHAVEMEFVDPVSDVRKNELANRPIVRTIEVERVAPLGMIPPRDVVPGILRQDIAFRPKVVVDDVQNDTQPQRVSSVDEAAHVIGSAIAVIGGEEIHTVVAPAK